MSDLQTCCDDTAAKPATHPFAKSRERGWTGLKVTELKNPIPGEIEDDTELEKVWEDHKLVPYSDSGYSLLLWYLILAKLSPTHAACIQKMKTYAIGSRAFFKRAEDPEYDLGEDLNPLSSNESKQFKDTLAEFVTFEGGIRAFCKKVLWQLKVTGNAFIEMSWSVTNGVYRFNIKAHKTTEVIYKYTKPGEMRVVAISPVWSSEYLKKFPPRLVPVSEKTVSGIDRPFSVKSEDGVERTVFHLKSGDNKWYGRPDSEGSDLYKYMEVQDSIYLIKQMAADLVGKMIIEVEDDDPDANPAIDNEGAQKAGFNSFADRMEQNYTQKGDDPSAIFVTARPIGSRPMFVYQIQPNTNENWFKVGGEIKEQKVLRSHGLTLRFMGFDVSTGFSSETFIADYVLNVEPVINALRADVLNFVNLILGEVWKKIGREELNQISVWFRSPIESQIEQFKKMSDGSTNADNPNGGAGQQPSGQQVPA